MKFLIFTLLFLGINITVFATHACNQLERDFYAKCNKHDSACTDLRLCQELRQDCPQPINSYATCEVFRECVAEKFPNGTKFNSCIYKWNSTPNEPGICANDNRYLDTIASTCPGYKVYFNDQFSDTNFNCNGHKGRYWSIQAECKVARDAYEKSIQEKHCEFTSNLPQVSRCEAAFNSVNLMESAEAQSNEVVDLPRDSYGLYDNLLETQGQFYTETGPDSPPQAAQK